MSQSPPDQDLPTGSPAAEGAAARPAISRRRATVVNLIYQTSSTGLMLVRGFLLVPLYLYYLDLELYGAWLATGNVLTLIMISEGGATHAIRQETAHALGRADYESLGRTIGAGFIVLHLLTLVAGAIGLGLTFWIGALMGLSGAAGRELTIAFSVAVVATVLSLSAGAPTAVQQGLQRHGLVGTIGLSAEALSVASTALLLVLGWGVLSIAAGMVVREVVRQAALWPLVLWTVRGLGVRIAVSGERIRSIFRLVAWTFTSFSAEVMMKNIDALAVSRFLGNELVPVAILTLRAWDTLGMLLTRLAFSFQPGLAHLHGSGDSPRFRAVASRLLRVAAVAIGVSGAVVLACNGPFVRLWAGEHIFAGHPYNISVGAAMAVWAFVASLSQIVLATGNVRGASLCTLIPMVARTVLLLSAFSAAVLLGIPKPATLLAIPLSTLLACTLVGGPYLVRQWRKTLQYEPGAAGRELVELGRPLLVGAACGLAWAWLVAPQTWTGLVAGAGGVLVVGCGAMWLLDPNARAEARAAGRSLSGRFRRRAAEAADAAGS